jgi:hypothetical protein
METITQKQIANYVGVSAVFVGLFRKEKRLFSKQKAKSLSVETGVGYDLLAHNGGEVGYQALCVAFEQQRGKGE